MNKGILILVAYISEFLIFCTWLATTKAVELGSSIGMDYVDFVLIRTIVVVYITWCWCLEGESVIYATLDYLLHIVKYVVFPIMDLICVDYFNK
jgi:Na+-transporting NADH:ubiquinone oxidoreductase subunit NqrE